MDEVDEYDDDDLGGLPSGDQTCLVKDIRHFMDICFDHKTGVEDMGYDCDHKTW